MERIALYRYENIKGEAFLTCPRQLPYTRILEGLNGSYWDAKRPNCLRIKDRDELAKEIINKFRGKVWVDISNYRTPIRSQKVTND